MEIPSARRCTLSGPHVCSMPRLSVSSDGSTEPSVPPRSSVERPVCTDTTLAPRFAQLLAAPQAQLDTQERCGRLVVSPQLLQQRLRQLPHSSRMTLLK